MRKIYKSLLCALAALTSLSASADTFKLYIEDASTVKVTIASGWMGSPVEQEVVDGWNNYEVSGEYAWNSDRIAVSGKDPYRLGKVVDADGNQQYIDGNGEWSMSGSNEGKEYSYTIEVYNLDDSRTASCTVNVDDASLIKVVRGGTGSAVTLQNGVNTVKFNPDLETFLTITGLEYQQPLYEVLLDNEPVQGSSEQYSVSLSEGCTIDITAVMPEGNVTVTFVYNEGGEGALINPTINGEPAEFVDNTLSVPIGAKMAWSGDPAFCIDALTIDGEENGWKGPWEIYLYEVVKHDMTVEVQAHRYADYDVTFKCTDPSHIKVYVGYPSSDNPPVELTGTESVIKVNENVGKIYWTLNTGCKLISATMDGKPLQYAYAEGIDHDGIVIELETYSVDFNRTAILYLEGLDKASYTQSIRGGDEDHTYFSTRNDPNYFEGYNTFKFADVYNPFTFEFYGYEYPIGYLDTHLYINDEFIPIPSGGYSHGPDPVDLADGDIVKLYVGYDPTVCHVQVEADAENTDKFEVVRDIIKTVTVEEFEGFDTFANTRMEIKPVGDSILKVTVNGTEVAKNDDGNFMFTVTPVEAEGETTREAGVTNVKVEFVGSGIDMIESEAGANAKAVYNLQGVKVADSLENLPAGLYITNGKKVIVK